MPKNSDDLVFSHRPGFSDFFQILHIFAVLNVVYDPFFTTKTTISKKNSLTTPFLLCSYFDAYPTTLLLKILGGRMHGPSPHLKFWGTVPQVSAPAFSTC